MSKVFRPILLYYAALRHAWFKALRNADCIEFKKDRRLVEQLHYSLPSDERWGDRKWDALQDLRTRLLLRNDQFWEDVSRCRKGIRRFGRFYRTKAYDILFRKWKLLRMPSILGGTIVGLSREEGSNYLTINVDLRYSEKKINEAMKLAVRVARDDYYYDGFVKWFKNTFLSEGDHPQEMKEKWLAEIEEYSGEWSEELKPVFKEFCQNEEEEVVPPDAPVYIQDPELYNKQIDAWDLKELERKSWLEIADEINNKYEIKTTTRQNAINYHRAAEKYIKYGIPGYPPFPPYKHLPRNPMVSAVRKLEPFMFDINGEGAKQLNQLGLVLNERTVELKQRISDEGNQSGSNNEALYQIMFITKLIEQFRSEKRFIPSPSSVLIFMNFLTFLMILWFVFFSD